MKKVNTIILGMAVLILFVGCGTTNGDTVTEEKAKREKVEGVLTYLSWNDMESCQPILDGFKEKYPDVTIDFQYIPNETEQYAKRLTQLKQAGELPDIFSVQPPATDLAEEGYLYPLEDLESVKNLPPKYQEAYSYNGHTYAYADSGWIGGVFYNKKMFETYNLQVPQTYEEFLEICDTFYSQGISPITMYANEIPDLVTWIHNTEVLAKNPQIEQQINTGESTFEELYLDNLKMWKRDFVDTGYLDTKYVDYAEDQRMEEFVTEESPMLISGNWVIYGIREQNPDLEFGVFPFVGTKGQTYTIGAVSPGIAISADAKNLTAAKAFVEFMGTQTGRDIFREEYDSLTYDKGGSHVDDTLKPLVPFMESGEFALPVSEWKYTNELTGIWNEGIRRILLGDMTPKELVEQMDDRQSELSNK